MIDARAQCETPEGITLQAELAGPMVRTLAYLADIASRFAIVAVCSVVLQLAAHTGTGLILILTFLLEWFYPVYFELYKSGQTPGKKMMRLRVVRDDLTPVSLGASITRNLLRAADFLPFMYLFGFICSLLNGQFKRLGDIAAGTVVIHATQAHAPVRGATDAVQPLAPDIELNMEEQITLMDFYDRHATFSHSRQLELAGVLQPVTGKASEQNLNVLLGYGAWMTGKH